VSDFAMCKELYDVRLPLEGHLDLTYRCNNNCRHCYINLPATDKEAKGKKLSLEEISAIASEAVSMGAV
jgi:MoaA/NifB/PqqE/SkfB family radical SAM enzyme